MFNKKKLTAAVLTVISTAALGATGVDEKEKPGTLIEEVTVTGIRKSLEAASDLKRFSAVVQDSIVAEDIGKFPDQNVAESLQRVPGVSIDRSNGEGSKITVRGFGPSFNVVKLNGRTLATSEVGREFDFQVLASELISGADVVKAPMAKTPEGSIGAYVNVKTARPLDKPGIHLSGSINGKYGELSEETNPEVSGVFSNTFLDDTLGINVAFSRQESENRYDSAGTTRWLLMNPGEPGVVTGDIHDTNGNVVTPEVLRHPGRIEFSLGQEERERTGVNVTLQWSPDESFVNTFDYMYTDFSAMTVTQGLQAGLQFPNWRNVVVSDNGTILAAEKFSGLTANGDRVDYRLDGLFQVLGTESKTEAFGFNSFKEIGDLTLEFDVGYSTSKATPRSDLLVPNYISPGGGDSLSFDFRESDVVDIDSTIDYADPSIVRAHWNQVAHKELEDEVTEARFEGSYNLDLNFGDNMVLESVDFGVAYSDREKTKDVYQTQHIDNCGLVNLGQNICGQLKDMPDEVFSVSSAGGFLSEETGAFPREFITINSVDQYHAAIREMTGVDNWPNELYNEVASTTATEKTKGIYGQLNFSGDIADREWRGNIGLRYVETKTTSTGYGKRRISLDGFLENAQPILIVGYTPAGQISAEQEYSNLLPSMNFSVDLTENLLARFAASKVISRPAIDDIGVETTYWDVHAGSFAQSGGNPYLAPYEAKQYDLSLEYYAENGSTYAVNFFHKDIQSFISNLTVLDDTPDIWNGSGWEGTTLNIDGFGQVIETVTRKQNRAGGTIKGIELAAQHYFDYLPGIWSGFGVQANYTWAKTQDKDATPIELEAVVDPGDKMEGFAEKSYNLIAFYDKGDFQARLAYNWRDDFLVSRSGVRSGGLPEHAEAYGQLDFSASYDLTDNFTLTAEAINITDERVYHYADVKDRFVNVQYSGPRYRLGLRAKF